MAKQNKKIPLTPAERKARYMAKIKSSKKKLKAYQDNCAKKMREYRAKHKKLTKEDLLSDIDFYKDKCLKLRLLILAKDSKIDLNNMKNELSTWTDESVAKTANLFINVKEETPREHMV